LPPIGLTDHLDCLRQSSCCLGTRSCSRLVPVLITQRFASRLLLPLRLSPPPSRRNLRANPPIDLSLLQLRWRLLKKSTQAAQACVWGKPWAVGVHCGRPARARSVALPVQHRPAGRPGGSLEAAASLEYPAKARRLAEPSQRSSPGIQSIPGFPKIAASPSRRRYPNSPQPHHCTCESAME